MVSFIDTHRADQGVEPICKQLPIAPSTYYEHKAREADPARIPARVKRDRGDTACVGGELPGIRRQEGVTPASTGRP